MRFPEFEGEWNEKKLGDLLEFKNGINASKEQYGSGVKFINVLDILSNDFITYETILGRVNVAEDIIAKNSVEYGDILFQRSSETREEVGTANVYLDKENTATFGGFVIRGKKVGEYEPVFLSKVLKTNAVRDSITSKAGGSTRYNIGQESLSTVRLCLPSLPEQQKIASFLSLIDERIDTQRKIISQLETLIKGVVQSLVRNAKDRQGWKECLLYDIIIERREANVDKHPVHSVSVSKGVINQIDYLGRSFAAKDTSGYNVVHYGDIVYTKSPTGEFPYGIVKQSFIPDKVAVSPLYGVFAPKDSNLGTLLHYYFKNPINANNYLHSLIQKGAKNTINISNQSFLGKKIYLPTNADEIEAIASLLNSLTKKMSLEEDVWNLLVGQKRFFLANLFI